MLQHRRAGRSLKVPHLLLLACTFLNFEFGPLILHVLNLLLRWAVRLSLAKCSLGIFPVSLLIETVERLRNEKQYIDLLNYEKI